MRQPHADCDLALEAGDRAFLVDPMRSHDLHRDIAEERAIPRAIDLVPRSRPKLVDDDERLIYLLTAAQIPAWIGVGSAGGDLLLVDNVQLHGPRSLAWCVPAAKKKEESSFRSPPPLRKVGPLGRAVGPTELVDPSDGAGTRRTR